jgi:hypothetical protein
VWLPNFFSTLTFIVVSVVSILAIPNALKNRRGFGWLMVGGWVAFVVSTPDIWGDGGFRGALILLSFIIPFFLLFFAATIQRQAIARLRDSVDLCCRPSSIIARSLRPPCTGAFRALTSQPWWKHDPLRKSSLRYIHGWSLVH